MNICLRAQFGARSEARKLLSASPDRRAAQLPVAPVRTPHFLIFPPTPSSQVTHHAALIGPHHLVRKPFSLLHQPRTWRLLAPWLVALCCLGTSLAQAPGKFLITFRGTAYEKAPSGNLVPTPITEKTLLEEAARAGGVTDLSTLALVYHVNGSSFGDTIDVVDSRTGVPRTTLLGFFFGEDRSLNRTALTNAAGTQVRRIDYLYTRQNSHSMGTGLVTRRVLRDTSGNIRLIVDGGQLQWLVLPENGKTAATMCHATFTTTRPFQPQP